MNDKLISLTTQDHIAIITIARQKKRNALDIEMLSMLSQHCDTVENDSNIRALIITGTDGSFCAGGDIDAWATMSPEEFGTQWVRAGHRAFARLSSLRMPVIAAMNGHGLGGGFELAAAADIRIAEEQIKIGMPETSIGMVPGWSGTQRMVKKFGAQIIRRMILGGELFSATQANDLGLVDLVAAPSSALEAAIEYAERIARRGPAATEIVKMMIAVANQEDDGSAVETLGSILVAKTGDLQEGVASFKEKRSANFTGQW